MRPVITRLRGHLRSVITMLRDLDNVDASNVGIYATSESTWISSYLLDQDPDVAFQVLLSPMVYSPRHSLGFLAAQDFALVGAHDGYQSIVRRAFNIDAELFGLTNLDLDHVESPSLFHSHACGIRHQRRDDRAGGRYGENHRHGA